jgi:hypothetical protein
MPWFICHDLPGALLVEDIRRDDISGFMGLTRDGSVIESRLAD